MEEIKENDPSVIIKSTLDHLSATKAYVEAFKDDIALAFQSGVIPEVQFLQMKARVDAFISKIELYKSVFVHIRDAYVLHKAGSAPQEDFI